MNNMEGIDRSVDMVGTLEFFARFLGKSELPAGVPGHLAALTFPLEAPYADCLPESFSASSLSFERTQLEGDHVMVIRLQVGALQFAWLADMLDPELWVTMDFWSEAKVAPIVIGIENVNQWDYRFFLPEMPERKSLYDGLCQKVGDVQSMNLWRNMVAAAAGEARPKLILARPLSTGRMPSYSWPRPVGRNELKSVLAPGDGVASNLS